MDAFSHWLAMADRARIGTSGKENHKFNGRNTAPNLNATISVPDPLWASGVRESHYRFALK